jgi:sec-independent protein translocase protein TatA
MFSFHWPELLVIVLLAAILFPKRLPQIGAGLGKGIRGFRKSVREIDEQTGLGELKDLGRQQAKDLKEMARVDLGLAPGSPATPPSASATSQAPPPKPDPQ